MSEMTSTGGESQVVWRDSFDPNPSRRTLAFRTVYFASRRDPVTLVLVPSVVILISNPDKYTAESVKVLEDFAMIESCLKRFTSKEYLAKDDIERIWTKLKEGDISSAEEIHMSIVLREAEKFTGAGSVYEGKGYDIRPMNQNEWSHVVDCDKACFSSKNNEGEKRSLSVTSRIHHLNPHGPDHAQSWFTRTGRDIFV